MTFLQIEDRNAALDDPLAEFRPARAANLLLWSILAFFLIFLLWAGLTQLDRAVRGAGRVVPSADLQVVSNLEGGIVSRILVKPGQMVRAGQPLLELDPIQLAADLHSSQAAADALAIKTARLQAEVDGRAPEFPAASDPALIAQIGIERSLHQSRMADLGSALATGEAQLNQARRAVDEAKASLVARTASADAARQQLDLLRPLVAQGIEPRASLVQAESAAAVAQAERAQAGEALARAQAGVAAAAASIARQRSEWRARTADELAAVGGDRVMRERALPALSDRLQRRIVRASMSGRVNRVLATTMGGTVRPGEPLVEIVPLRDKLVVETELAPKDIAFVRLGQRAKVNITAYDSAVYGAIGGRVVGISPDAVLDSRGGGSHFIVRVETDASGLRDRAGHDLPIGPGMTASVSLLGDRRSVLSYLLTPIFRLGETAFRE
jgi:adhesin transport system membrane fusion protein